MIPNQWYAVLESKEVPAGKLVGVTRMGEKLVFWRDAQGQVSCLRDLCPHRGVALSRGKIVEHTLECPFHAFRFDSSGACTLVPANGRNGPTPRQIKAFSYPTYEQDGFIFIWWGEAERAVRPPQYFDDLGESLDFATARDPWKIHYSRAIENQLDVAHVPFVHANTIGRGGATLVDGPVTQWLDENRFRVYTFNRQDDGSRARRPDEIQPPEGGFHLEFIFPNLWQNHISEQVRVTVAFAPVDEENTILYLRFYQGLLQVPGLRRVVTWLSLPLNVYIAHQDRRIVETQLPKASSLRMGEKLIQADRPIIEYRRRRQELIDCAQARA
jgi:phenylpropionate dioxygenase-like ring-hydroxylating dioxygenase large terminal subunit